MEEIWKPVKGYEGIYEVSNLGRVKRLPRLVVKRNGVWRLKEKILEPCSNKGYLYLRLTADGIKKKYLVHRLVAEAFIPNPNNLPEINHKDEDPTNNCVWNLEWCTRAYNVNYGGRNKRMIATNNRNGNNCAELPVEQYTLDGKFIAEYKSMNEASRQTGIPTSNICFCCQGKYKQIKGFVFHYKEKNVAA